MNEQTKKVRSRARKYRCTRCDNWLSRKTDSMMCKRCFRIGAKASPEARRAMSQAQIALGRKGEKHPRWKPHSVNYFYLHKWVGQQLGKASVCSFDPSHVATRYHWANKSHEYKRDLDDWMSLCPKCHFGYDKTGEKISQFWKRRREERKEVNVKI